MKSKFGKINYRALFKSYIGLFVIPLFFLLSALVILPVLNTPFNDDWCYARMTKHFYQSGEISFFNWGEPTLLGNILWGTLFAKIFGWSFTSLHLSTLVLSVLAGIIFYLILKLFQIKEFIALTGAALLLFNPIFFVNSFTFMTDVPFLAIILVSTYFFLLFEKKQKMYYLVMASIAGILAFSSRQTAILLPFAYFISLLIKKDKTANLKLLTFWSLIVPLLVDSMIAIWRYTQPNIYSRAFELPKPVWSVQLAFYMLIYVGLFLLPLTVSLCVSKKFRRLLWKKIDFLIFIGIIFILALMAIATGKLMPYLGNQISTYGMFRLNEIIVGEREIMFPVGFWSVLTIASVLSASIFLFLLLLSWRYELDKLKLVKTPIMRCIRIIIKRMSKNPALIVYFITFLFFIFPILIGNAFDRYIILILPGIILFFARLSKRFSFTRIPLLIGIFVTLIFTITIVSDTLSWHSAAWKEAETLTATGIPATQIDAGFTWCGWHHPGLVGAKEKSKSDDYYISSYLRRFFPNCDNQYCISFSPMRGFEVIRQVSYKGAFWLGEKKLYILKRLGS